MAYQCFSSLGEFKGRLNGYSVERNKMQDFCIRNETHLRLTSLIQVYYACTKPNTNLSKYLASSEGKEGGSGGGEGVE